MSKGMTSLSFLLLAVFAEGVSGFVVLQHSLFCKCCCLCHSKGKVCGPYLCIDDRKGQGDHLKFAMVLSEAFGLADKPRLGHLSEFNNIETRC